MGRKILNEVISWAIMLAIAVFLAILINKTIIFIVEIPTSSMTNTILVGDKVITNRLAYKFGDPKRGDIVVFPLPDNEEVDYIKRIIGLPGETIEGKDGLVYINGEPLEEKYVKEKLKHNFGPYTVPAGCYFMLGDNRNGSEDSRFWNNKFLQKEKIKGKAVLKYPKFTIF